MQVLFRGPETTECQRDLYGPLPQWLGLEGETPYETAYYRLSYEEEDAHGHPRPVYIYDHTQQVP
jgi:hypothetical protein